MPLNIEYYTEPNMISEWLDSEPGVYPEESRDVFVDYTLDNTPVQPSVYWLRNWGQINNEVITPAMQLIWTNEAAPQEAMDQAVEDARPLLQGRW
jgi:ABC-type glycerol-3-phosphate transport system substrate-binding protein